MNSEEYTITQQNIYNYKSYNNILIILFVLLFAIYLIMIIKKAN